ncbi:hypothetical protein MTO96_042876 [Rhipicephalus appendiculatus]
MGWRARTGGAELVSDARGVSLGDVADEDAVTGVGDAGVAGRDTGTPDGGMPESTHVAGGLLSSTGTGVVVPSRSCRRLCFRR